MEASKSKLSSELSCPICDIHNSFVLDNEKGNEDTQEKWIGFSDFWILRKASEDKNCPGYLYLEPRDHVESFASISSKGYQELGEWIEKANSFIHSHFNPKKIYLVTISEAVPHIHFHFVPRYQDEVKGLDYIGYVLRGEWRG